MKTIQKVYTITEVKKAVENFITTINGGQNGQCYKWEGDCLKTWLIDGASLEKSPRMYCVLIQGNYIFSKWHDQERSSKTSIAFFMCRYSGAFQVNKYYY